MGKLLVEGLLPPDDDERAAWRAASEGVCKHAAALRLKVEQTEAFIKHGMPSHLPSCDAPEPAADAATCPEHYCHRLKCQIALS